jgi:Fanconi anemia group M protein
VNAVPGTKGNVIVLVAKGTRDEAYKWSAHHKEKRMYRTLKDIKKGFVRRKASQTLNDFMHENVNVHCDYREKGSPVMKKLLEMGADLQLVKLDNADYQLSPRVAVEYKTVEDFVVSLIDGRLLSQIKEIRRNFARPIVMVEGEGDIYSVRKVHPNAIRGLISTIIVSYGVPLLFTKNHVESAAMLWMIAKREQEKTGNDFSAHGDKPASSLTDQQEYMVSSIQGIGPALAKELLLRFGSIKQIANASTEELMAADKVGKKTAERIREIFDSEYNPKE